MKFNREIYWKVIEKRWFHGTSKENADSIMKHGFKIIEKTDEAALGFGTYFTDSISRAMYYAKRFPVCSVIEISFPDEYFNVGVISDFTGTFGTLEQHAKGDVEYLNSRDLDELIQDDEFMTIIADKYGSVEKAWQETEKGRYLFDLEDVINSKYVRNGYLEYIGDRTDEIISSGIQAGVSGDQLVIYDASLLKKLKARIVDEKQGGCSI